ncbi:MAG TPA: hypothetical protein VGZ22_25985 [Isosphaeraceae bacterium]|jgi:WD40 repeat protein|nr:hypothetical protein [Isosphaeraceae bacterium]
MAVDLPSVNGQGEKEPSSRRRWGGRRLLPIVAIGLVAVAVVWWLCQPPPSWPRRVSVNRGPGAVLALAYAPDGKRLAIHDQKGGLTLLDPATGELRTVVTPDAKGGLLTFSREGGILASGQLYFGHTIEVWDMATCQPIAHPEAAADSSLRDIRFSADGSVLLAASTAPSDTVRVETWNTHSWQRSSVLNITKPGSNYAEISPDGSILATGTIGGEVAFWDIASGQPRGTFQGLNAWVRAVAFSPDGKTLAFGQYANGSQALFDQPGTVWLLEVPTGRLRARLQAHAWHLAFSPDGHTLMAAGAQAYNTSLNRLPPRLKSLLKAYLGIDVKRHQELMSWDLTQLRQTAVLVDPDTPFSRMAFAPDGRSLATSFNDGSIVLWDVPDKR